MACGVKAKDQTEGARIIPRAVRRTIPNKRENVREYFIEASGTTPFNPCYSIKAQLREIAMINFALGVPVKTRLPFKAWTLAAIITLVSLASSIIHSHAPSDHAIYAGMIWKLVWPS